MVEHALEDPSEDDRRETTKRASPERVAFVEISLEELRADLAEEQWSIGQDLVRDAVEPAGPVPELVEQEAEESVVASDIEDRTLRPGRDEFEEVAYDPLEPPFPFGKMGITEPGAFGILGAKIAPGVLEGRRRQDLAHEPRPLVPNPCAVDYRAPGGPASDALKATQSAYRTPVPPKMSKALPMVRSMRPLPRRSVRSRSASERAPPA